MKGKQNRKARDLSRAGEEVKEKGTENGNAMEKMTAQKKSPIDIIQQKNTPNSPQRKEQKSKSFGMNGSAKRRTHPAGGNASTNQSTGGGPRGAR